MRIDYSTFEYKNGWYGNILNPVSNKNIIVHISSNDSKLIPNECKEALDWFVENYEAMHDEMLYEVLEYYCEERENLGYDVEENEDYPFVSSIDEISNMITFRAITIPNQQRFIKGVFLLYDCTWDIEEGLGIRIVDGQIIRVGNQGIAP